MRLVNEIKKYVDNLEIVYKEETKSTNVDAKEIAVNEKKDNVLVVTCFQTNGRGRLGRDFYSPKETGVYFSLIIKPTVPAYKCSLITTSASVAVSTVLDEIFGVKTEIKWVNDIFYNGKKVCGILTESVNNFEYAVLGIGINVAYPKEGFPHELKNIAGAMCQDADDCLKGQIIGKILQRILYYNQNFYDAEIYNNYTQKNYLKGKTITVPQKGQGKVIGIDKDYRLIVEYNDGKTDYLVSGEVSLHDTCR